MKLINRVRCLLSKPEWFFVVFSIIIGGSLIIIIPPFRSPDEIGHFYKSYAVSEGRLLNWTPLSKPGSGAFIPSSLEKLVQSTSLSGIGHYGIISSARVAVHIRLQPSDRVYKDISNVASYPPVAYLPQATGIALARIFTDRVLILYYAAKLVSFAVFVLLGFLAIRLIPRAKWLIAALGLLPMTLFLSATLSADTPTIAVAMVFAALIVKYYYQEKIATKQWLILGVVAVLLALCKQAYFILSPAVVVLLLNRSANKRLFLEKKELFARLKWVVLILLSVGIGLLGWLFLDRSVSKDIFINDNRPAEQVVYPDQQVWLLTHQPQDFLSKMAQATFGPYSSPMYQQFFGYFGWLDVAMPLWVALGLLSIIILLLGFPEPQQKKDIQKRTLLPGSYLALIGVACYGAIMAGLYIYWTPKSSIYVAGFQGRYLIPLALLVGPWLVGWYRHTISVRYLMTAYAVLAFIGGPLTIYFAYH